MIPLAALVVMAATLAMAGPEDTKYGKPITIKEVTPLGDILKSPEKFIGKEVHTVGYIYEMCTGSGCWLGILPSVDSDQILKVSWMETDVRFPIGEETTGHMVHIQGEIISAEQEAEEHAVHAAEEGHEMEHAAEEAAEKPETRTVYFCPMHADVVQETEGTCPLCHMNLRAKEVPVPAYGSLAIKGIGAIVKEKPAG
jgi:hypothetical protein